jgi:hypothetical protein
MKNNTIKLTCKLLLFGLLILSNNNLFSQSSIKQSPTSQNNIQEQEPFIYRYTCIVIKNTTNISVNEIMEIISKEPYIEKVQLIENKIVFKITHFKHQLTFQLIEDNLIKKGVYIEKIGVESEKIISNERK